MRSTVRLFAAVFAIGFVLAGEARAALTNDQLVCQNTVAIQGRKLFKKVFNALAKCQDSIASGKLPVGTDCTVEADTAAKITKAENSLGEKVQQSCSDATIASLDFGASCFAVTTKDDLVACTTAEHESAAQSLIAVAYADPARRCVGGTNDGLACASDTDCLPDGTCTPLDTDHRKCLRLLSKTVSKQAGKRLNIIQRCKKKVSRGDLPPSTDCVADGSDKLSDLMQKSVSKIATACPDMVTQSLHFGDVCQGNTATSAMTACALCLDDRQADNLILMQYGSSPLGATASVKKIANTADCVAGPMSRCRVDDYLMANDKIRVVVQSLQRNIFGIGQFGGQIIDADLVRSSGPDRDNFEEWSISLNIENTAHYTSLSIINDGSNGGPAILRATGVDDLLDFLNPSTVVAGFGFPFPASADDKDLPVTVMTDYILDPGKNYVRVETTIQNMGGTQLKIFFGEFINGSGEVPLFEPGYGFGEPLVTTSCPLTPQNLCNFIAYKGEGGADGVSYGYIHDVPASTAFNTAGVSVPQLGVEVLLALIGLAQPPFTIEPMSVPGDALEFTRYFVVGNGTVSSITDARNEIKCLATGRLQGTVTAGGNPAIRADVAILGNVADGPGTASGLATLASKNEVTHTLTDNAGNYSLTLPIGSYTVIANIDGYPYEGGGSTPMSHPVTISAFSTTTQDLALPATGSLRVTAVDGDSDPIAFKASVVGFDPSPDPLITQTIAGGLVRNTTGVFNDRTKDNVPFGLAKTFFVGPSGDSDVVPIEPPTDPDGYQVVVSHGPEFSIDSINVTPAQVSAGAVVNAQVERVIDSTGFISADFHVHCINSADSRIPEAERVRTELAEGMDFFTPSDHEFLSDFHNAVSAAGATGLISVATGQEITTFDYGHFNAWPLTIDPTQVNGGAVDHGGAAPDGQDFPSYGNYSEPPVNIIALARHLPSPGASTVQINHIHSHFSLDGNSGLAIDTGMTPPQSHVPGVARRLNPALTNYFTDTFDALEIWIGDNRQQMFDNFLGQVPTGRGGNIGDWFNMINQGIVRTGVADSDTHTRIQSVAGFPHTMVASPSDDAGDLEPLAPTLSSNVNAGRAFGTNAPMVRVTAHAVSTGESAGLDVGRCTGAVPCTSVADCKPCTDDDQCAMGESCTALPTLLRTSDGAVDIVVDVQSPTWAQFDKVEFYVNPATTKRTLTGLQTGAGAINVNRYQITPTVVNNVTPSLVPVGGSNRLQASTTLNLTGLTADAWVVVLVKGTDGVSKPLFPVLPADLKTTGNSTLAQLTDGNLGENGITALAFTNPILIDVNGGGWTAPGVQVTNP